ncbi:D-alanine--D-alanine ligase [Clostridium homopropionicum DSM 5847]|uniref:D-alanine--D-alanine ligase n=1 Tax=Clostridium homopropionicum DSM 5847 TaxID=1121318 RepID=A0A0L6Z7M4_9CLOT|nr:ATP-grasp domain-containing protein [Clostridium homopropionicum]KOA18971.1 D-alanine--D-alanine ligase [Clostridium homopropionicum DSM 5847]SFG43055.1 Biotin carboxylase [Clostridium homopropionicum]
MKLLILGGGHCQLNAILKAKNQGHSLIISDYYEDAPGKSFCDYKELISTFDVDGNIEIGKKYSIDGILTLGTDQPVYTASKVQEALNLPFLIDAKTAKAVTNKKIMKTIFKDTFIPTTKFTFIKRDFEDKDIANLKFPVVIKPLDSQGQRGIYKLNSIKEVRNNIDKTLSYSRENEILIEEYYENDEITVSGWVEENKVYVLTVTDRVTYNNYPLIGICTAHNFPSKHLFSNCNEIMDITCKLVQSFNIHNGPIYFQMLVGKEGIKVNEIACRIGGAYEDIFIPYLTGIDILDMLIKSSLGITLDLSNIKKYNILDNNRKLSVQLLFAKPGKIKAIELFGEETFGDSPEISSLFTLTNPLPGVKKIQLNIKKNDEIGEIINATQRIGYMIVEGSSNKELKKNLYSAFDNFKIIDSLENNLLINFHNYM